MKKIQTAINKRIGNDDISGFFTSSALEFELPLDRCEQGLLSLVEINQT